MIRLRYLLFLMFLYTFNAYCMIDNRFLPLYRQQYIYKTPCKKSSFATNVLLLIANKSFGSDGKDIEFPEINGKYDLISVTNALEDLGKNPPLISQSRVNQQLELDLEGKLEGQGFWLGYEQNIFDHFYLGISTYLIHLISRKNFIISDSLKRQLKLIKGSEVQFDKDLRDTNNMLGINSYQFNKTGVSDIDLYLRLGTVKDYFYKFRKIDIGLSLGTLIPSGPKVDINNPASIPFGGNGHWGIYLMTDLNLELKEDLYVGFWFEILKRLSKTCQTRIPTRGEVLEFAALQGIAKVDPGVTIGFSPFFALDDIRDGFGFKMRYTLIYHEEDEWRDTVKDRMLKVKNNDKFVEKAIKAKFGEVIEKSKWSAEYLTFSLTYNFGNSASKSRSFAPIIYLEWDRPTKIFFARNAAKTNRVSFGFEFNF